MGYGGWWFEGRIFHCRYLGGRVEGRGARGWVGVGARTFHCGYLRGYTSITVQHSLPTQGSLIESHNHDNKVTPMVFSRLKTSGFGIRLHGPKSRQRLVRIQNTAAGGILFHHQGQLSPDEIHTLWTCGQWDMDRMLARVKPPPQLRHMSLPQHTSCQPPTQMVRSASSTHHTSACRLRVPAEPR